jgi:hypothetical protein
LYSAHSCLATRSHETKQGISNVVREPGRVEEGRGGLAHLRSCEARDERRSSKGVVRHPLSFSCRVVCHAYINEIPCNAQRCHRRSSSSSGGNIAPCSTSFISVAASYRSSPFPTYMGQHSHLWQTSQPSSTFAVDESWGAGTGGDGGVW